MLGLRTSFDVGQYNSITHASQAVHDPQLCWSQLSGHYHIDPTTSELFSLSTKNCSISLPPGCIKHFPSPIELARAVSCGWIRPLVATLCSILCPSHRSRYFGYLSATDPSSGLPFAVQQFKRAQSSVHVAYSLHKGFFVWKLSMTIYLSLSVGTTRVLNYTLQVNDTQV